MATDQEDKPGLLYPWPEITHPPGVFPKHPKPIVINPSGGSWVCPALSVQWAILPFHPEPDQLSLQCPLDACLQTLPPGLGQGMRPCNPNPNRVHFFFVHLIGVFLVALCLTFSPQIYSPKVALVLALCYQLESSYISYFCHILVWVLSVQLALNRLRLSIPDFIPGVSSANIPTRESTYRRYVATCISITAFAIEAALSFVRTAQCVRSQMARFMIYFQLQIPQDSICKIRSSVSSLAPETILSEAQHHRRHSSRLLGASANSKGRTLGWYLTPLMCKQETVWTQCCVEICIFQIFAPMFVHCFQIQDRSDSTFFCL